MGLQESVCALDLEGEADKGGCNVETDPQDSNHPSGNHKFEEEKGDKKEGNTKPTTWAGLVNPNLASTIAPDATLGAGDTTLSSKLSMKKNVSFSPKISVEEEKDAYLGGQFSDAEDDESIEIPSGGNNDNGSDGDSYEYCEDDVISDEDCDIYIRDAEEVEWKEGSASKIVNSSVATEELDMDFPSLAAASTVPYNGSDDEDNETRT